MRGERCTSAPPVCSGAPKRSCGFPQLGLPGPGLRMDTLSGVVPSLTGHHRPVCYLPQPSTSGLFFPDGRSAVCGDRSHAPILGQSPGLRVSPVQLHPSCPRQGPSLLEYRGNINSTFLAPEALVSGPTGAVGGGSGPSAYAEVSTQTTPLSSLPSEPPVLWLTGFCIARDHREASASLQEWRVNLPSAAALQQA